MVANDEPASWNVVMPFDSDFLRRQLEHLRARAPRLASASARRHALIEPGRRLAQQPGRIAAASFRISPPAGFGVVRDAGQLHRLARSRSWRGRWRASAAPGCSATPRRATRASGNPSTFGVGRAVHFSWCQPRPMIHSPGFAVFAASATIATISSQLVVVISFSLSCASPTPVKCPWPSMKPGIASCPCRSMTWVPADVSRDVGGAAERRRCDRRGPRSPAPPAAPRPP